MRVQEQVDEDAALARAIHVSQLDVVWPPGPEMDLAGALPRPFTPLELERHTAMTDSGSRANSASELGLPTAPGHESVQCPRPRPRPRQLRLPSLLSPYHLYLSRPRLHQLPPPT